MILKITRTWMTKEVEYVFSKTCLFDDTFWDFWKCPRLTRDHPGNDLGTLFKCSEHVSEDWECNEPHDTWHRTLKFRWQFFHRTWNFDDFEMVRKHLGICLGTRLIHYGCVSDTREYSETSPWYQSSFWKVTYATSSAPAVRAETWLTVYRALYILDH